jgi:hypothetical protein
MFSAGGYLLTDSPTLGFVAFNIDYRLAHTHGLLPPGKTPTPPSPPHGGPPPPPPPVAVGAKLVSHLARSPYFFSPHPSKPEGKIHRVDPDFGSTLTASNRDSQSNCWFN